MKYVSPFPRHERDHGSHGIPVESGGSLDMPGRFDPPIMMCTDRMILFLCCSGMLDVALAMPCGPEDWCTRLTEATGCHRIIPISISPINQVPIHSVGSDADG